MNKVRELDPNLISIGHIKPNTRILDPMLAGLGSYAFKGNDLSKKIQYLVESGTSLENYTVSIEVPFKEGMLSDFSNIYFTSKNYKKLYEFWLEYKLDSNYAIFWVKIPVIPATPGNTIVNAMYDSTIARKEPSIYNTFVQATDYATNDETVYREAGTDKVFGASTGEIRSNAGKLDVVAMDRTDPHRVYKPFSNYKDVKYVVEDATNLVQPEDVIVVGAYAFVACRFNGGTTANLSVFRVEGGKPVYLTRFTDSDLTEAMGMDVNLTDNILYLTSWINHKLLLLDISDPENITKISSITVGNDGTGGDPDPLRKVFYQSGYCYCTHLQDSRLYIVNVSNPSSPSITGSCYMGNVYNPFSVYVNGNYAYVGIGYGDSTGNMKVVDVTDKVNPVVSSTLTNTAHRAISGFARNGNYLYVSCYEGDGMAIFDISNASAPSLVGSLTDSTKYKSANRITYYDNKVYLAGAGQYSIPIVDVTNPAAPSYIESIKSDAFKKLYSVYAYNGMVYAVGRDINSFCVYDIGASDTTYSDNFALRVHVKPSASMAAGWVPLACVATDSQSMINNIDSQNGFMAAQLAVVYYTNAFILIEFYNTTYVSGNSVPAANNTEYICEIKKIGTSASMQIRTLDGGIIGTSTIATLNSSTRKYKCLVGVTGSKFTGTNLISTWESKFIALRKRITTEPTITGLNIPAPVKVKGGLVAYYPFHGNAIDETANTNDLTVSGATLTVDKNGNTDRAYSCGINKYLQAANHATLNTASVSFSLWFKASSLSSYATLIGRIVDNNFNSGWGLYFTSNSLRFYVGTYTSYANKAFTPDGNWHHVVGTWDGTTKRIYLDNVEGTSATTGSSTTTAPLRIGRGPDGSDNYYSAADIANVRLYGRVLVAEEISILYAE